MLVLQVSAPFKSQQQPQQNTQYNAKVKRKKEKTVSFDTLLKMAMEQN